jgi:uncharacterized protein YdaU (DUF1376 family)
MSKRRKPIWMTLYVKDFLVDTAHLTAAQVGAYINLLCHMWRSDDGTLPNDPTVLARVSKVNPPNWARTWKAIKSLFVVDGELVTNADLQVELGKANALLVLKRAQGSLGGQTTQFKKTLRAGLAPTLTPPKALKNNNGVQAGAQPNHNHNIEKKEEEMEGREGHPRPNPVGPSPKENGYQEETPGNPSASARDRAMQNWGQNLYNKRSRQ